ncbi:ArsR/SmtB family transcription factor [Polynucleobacter asymbioticus]|jgi:ArsR family transcriptional regulator|uniref:Transcriptional regulator, ArsR family n=1 Tax=Polynucleobacter asymbioticus (strain DSM 18221 / CIP 109841 / QLW-P1DMWA-1) TaxID=312153 RepID=A4SWZ7_POLAQ|nr:metalloregulator ArsR/SmtB family transcription factor [Polynucleobacter asymbioticus]ABP34011.1 transcriptional regulator, ArsR family [Polynucleobacter asymbioticus QLW-P1DMWA-1]APC05871.1 transcriptional regulator [Polynucleobacter asymbioticus]
MTTIQSKINLKKMQASADEACRLMKVLANRDRMLLLCEISQGEKCVGELEEALDIHQPTLSQQLTVLRNEELVKTRREGKQIYYSLSSSEALEVMSVLYKNYCGK